MRGARLAAIMAVASLPFIGSAASAAVCPTADSSIYTAGGFSCNVDGVIFSNMSIITHVGPNSTLSPITVSPFIGIGEFGLQLNYFAFANGPGAFVDIAWSYTATAAAGLLLHDALLSYVGQVTGDGTAGVSETLSNNVVLSLNGSGTVERTFTPIGALTVLKDEFNFVPGGICDLTTGRPCAGTSTSSILVNAFSVTQVPIPGAAGLFLTGLGMMGVLGWRRKRSTQTLA